MSNKKTLSYQERLARTNKEVAADSQKFIVEAAKLEFKSQILVQNQEIAKKKLELENLKSQEELDIENLLTVLNVIERLEKGLEKVKLLAEELFPGEKFEF